MNTEPEHKGRKLLTLFGFLAGTVCTGALLACSFPPMEEYQSAWVALVPLIICARYCTPKRMFLWGWFSGGVFWLFSISWLLKIAGRGTNLFGAVSAWIAISVYCAAYMGLFGMILSHLFGKLRFSVEREEEPAHRFWQPGYSKKLLLVVLIPILWVGLEYLRGILFTGFPWNFLGISQFRNIVLIQVADIGGVYAVSFLVAVMNASIAMVVLGFIDVYAMRKPAGGVRLELFIGLFICALCWAYGVRKAPEAEAHAEGSVKLRIASIQPNIVQQKKWQDFEALSIKSLGSNTELASATSPDLIVWPETAVAAALEAEPFYREFVSDVVRRSGAALLTGAMEIEPDLSYKGKDAPGAPWNTLYYNASYLIDENGGILQKYRKMHLVPFGEYLPFDKKIRLLKHISPLGFSCTPGEDMVVFELPVGVNEADKRPARFSSLICFEDVFPHLSRKAVKGGARLLINQTNDAWFDGSSGAMQHMSHCVFRCVENRVPVIRCTNTGVTCLINKSGKIKKTLLASREGWISEGMILPPDDMPMTFYARFGDLPFALPCGIITVVLFILVVRRKEGDG